MTGPQEDDIPLGPFYTVAGQTLRLRSALTNQSISALLAEIMHFVCYL